MFERAGINTGMNLESSVDAANYLETILGKTVPGMLMKAGIFPDNVVAPLS